MKRSENLESERAENLFDAKEDLESVFCIGVRLVRVEWMNKCIYRKDSNVINARYYIEMIDKCSLPSLSVSVSFLLLVLIL